jgi:hypothetical protein
MATPPVGARGCAARLRGALAAVDRELLPCKQFCFWAGGGQACYYAFLPVVYAQLGLPPAHVGVLTGVAPLVQACATPAWAACADAARAHRAILLATLAGGALLHCALPLCPPRLAWLLPLVIVSEAVAAPAGALADAAIGLTLQARAHPHARHAPRLRAACVRGVRRRAHRSAARTAHALNPAVSERTVARAEPPLTPFRPAARQQAVQ